MLNRLFKYLKGYVKIKVEGYSPERFLNLCNVHHYLIWNVDYHEMSYELYISVRDYKKTRPLARKTGTKIILLEKLGLPFFLHKFRKRKLFFSGMFLCTICIYLLSLFVWNIHLEGNVTQSTQEILEFLDTMEVHHGAKKTKIVCEEIETKLRSQYPNILWVSAEMRGTRIIIQVKENEDKDIVSSIEEKDASPVRIVADTEGTIAQILVRSGTPLVKSGDEVSVGQTLVEGHYVIKNDAGDVVRYEGVAADADIRIMTVENYHDSFSTVYEKKNYTDKKKLGFQLKLFDKTYQLLPKKLYENYETIIKTKETHITENFYLPFSITFQWYLEYVPEELIYSKEEMKSKAEKRFYEKYKNILQKGVQIIEKDVIIDTNGKLCLVSGTVKCVVPQTKKVPADLSELKNDASLEGEN